jgi:hypothetical protein
MMCRKDRFMVGAKERRKTRFSAGSLLCRRPVVNQKNNGDISLKTNDEMRLDSARSSSSLPYDPIGLGFVGCRWKNLRFCGAIAQLVLKLFDLRFEILFGLSLTQKKTNCGRSSFQNKLISLPTF